MAQTYRLVGGPLNGRITEFLPSGYTLTGTGHSVGKNRDEIPLTAEFRDDGMDEMMREVIEAHNELSRLFTARGIEWDGLAVLDGSDGELMAGIERMRQANARQLAWLDEHVPDGATE